MTAINNYYERYIGHGGYDTKSPEEIADALKKENAELKKELTKIIKLLVCICEEIEALDEELMDHEYTPKKVKKWWQEYKKQCKAK